MQDTQLRKIILEQLEYEPSIDAADIGVAVEDGTVTLTGHVRSYTEKRTAEDIVKRVKGVHAIAEEIEVRPVGAHITADDEIAKRAAEALRWHYSVPEDAVQVRVENGFLTLSGCVKWHYQKKAAENAVHDLVGVRGLTNLIDIVPEVTASDIRKRIENAFRRDAELEARQIIIDVTDRTVTLRGHVRNWAERQAAERAAWAAPGVSAVIDHISVTE